MYRLLVRHPDKMPPDKMPPHRTSLPVNIFIITPKQQTVDIIIQYNTTQHNHHESRKELIDTQ